jgi:alpha-glucosidase
LSSNWWRTAVIYQIYVRSFADSDGDGNGDLPGARSRLPYLRDLGVDAIWLTPFYTSPLADGGYDVADYRDVDPMFGTLPDFDALLADAHRLGLRVIVDLVPNHSSSAHPWFRAALAAEPGTAARDRYIFRPGRGVDGEQPPNDWRSVFGGPAWTRLPDGDWYLHLFAPEQPDLNWRNDFVREEFRSILRFWLDRGVDGFRVDVAHGLIKADGLPDVGSPVQAELIGRQPLPYFDQDDVHEIYREWRKLLDSYTGDRIGVAEAWAPDNQRLANYIRPDELHQAFNFHFLGTPWDPEHLRSVIDESLATAGAVGAPTVWVLSNHDSQRRVTRYGGGLQGLRRARAAALLMLALPGSAYIYQGDELGLPEVTDLPDAALQDPVWLRSGGTDRGRDGCRVPIPWAGNAPSYGFGPTAASWLPAPSDWAALSVVAQDTDPSSTLNLYRTALRRRSATPGFAGYAMRWLDGPPHTLVLGRDHGVVCAVNLGDQPATLPPPAETLCASSPVHHGSAGELVLPPDTAAWYRA